MDTQSFAVLGAGVIGLSTAIALRDAYPDASISILAQYFPGDYNVDYTSPWAGGNWCSSATDNGLLEECDRITFEKFSVLADTAPECGIARSPLRMIFDQKIEDAGILSESTGKIWYEKLVGGLIPLRESALPSGAAFGYDVPSTFVINTQVYLQWFVPNHRVHTTQSLFPALKCLLTYFSRLLAVCRSKGVKLVRQRIDHIDNVRVSHGASAVFNCTGLGSYSLGGVEDKSMYPTRGQTILVEQPLEPLSRMYFRSPARVDNDTTYIFQRPLGGGIVLGGCRENGNWNGQVDLDFAQQIMRKCCALAPELGKPEDLKVIRHGVGLRPSREGGPRMEAEWRAKGLVVVHNYGASGAGYQASW